MDKFKLPAKVANALEDFSSQLRALYQDGLIAVILYGSASSGEFTEKYSNVNVLVVLDDASLDNLCKSRSIVNSKKFSMISPLFFTEEYINSSLDVFPIEFLDISENYAMLYGRDVVKGLKVHDKNLRFQCEQELKGKLINIRKRYLAIKDQNDLEGLLFKTFTSTLHIMRNLLRLKGIKPPYGKQETINESEKSLGLDTKMLSEILWAKNKKIALTRQNADTLIHGLVKAIESLAFTVDKL